jgi:hypothetical protein
MSGSIQKTRWALGGTMLLLSTLAVAGAPAGHPDSIDSKLRQPLMQGLDRERYLDSEYTFQRAVSAYLWDNRHLLTITDFPKDRQIDVLVCLLHDKGNLGLKEFVESASMKKLCKDMLKPHNNPASSP